MLVTLASNISNSPIRRERLHGRDYIVAPTAMLTEGVHAGSEGPMLYRESECKKASMAWNMKPVVVYHPEINGQGCSACDPDILEAQQVGMLMNTGWRDKLRTETWIEEKRAGEVDDRVLVALEENKVMEVSTGLGVDPKGGPGEWNGTAYNSEAVNHQPDHLALLPDKIGACSVADGAGLLQLNEAATVHGIDVTPLLVREMDTLRRMVGNAMSHSNTHSALMRSLKEKAGDGAWIIDVYDNFFIYDVEGDSKIFRLDYAMDDKGVEIVGEPEEVVKVTEYRKPDGAFVGNQKATKKNKAEKSLTVNKRRTVMKDKLVDALIANEATQWDEEDREVLMGMDEGALEKMTPVANEGGKPPADDTKLPADDGKPEDGEKPPVGNAAPPTLEGYLAAAPPEIRGVLTNAIATHNQTKDALVKQLVANKRNQFSEKFLGTKDIPELQGMLALVGNEASAEPQAVPMFNGASTPAGAPIINNEAESEFLETPVMDFSTAGV